MVTSHVSLRAKWLHAGGSVGHRRSFDTRCTLAGRDERREPPQELACGWQRRLRNDCWSLVAAAVSRQSSMHCVCGPPTLAAGPAPPTGAADALDCACAFVYSSISIRLGACLSTGYKRVPNKSRILPRVLGSFGGEEEVVGRRTAACRFIDPTCTSLISSRSSKGPPIVDLLQEYGSLALQDDQSPASTPHRVFSLALHGRGR